jgi:dephospho-CoA kinase
MTEPSLLFDRPNKKRSLLAVCGLSGVGKTSICRELQRYGYASVSASQVAAKMYASFYGHSPNRRELAEYGTRLLKSHLEDDFLARILSELPLRGNVVVDGLRSMLTLNHLQAHLGAIAVFVVRNSSSLQALNISDVDSELVRLSAEVDSHLSMTGFTFDLILDNNMAIADTCEGLIGKLNEISLRRNLPSDADSNVIEP